MPSDALILSDEQEGKNPKVQELQTVYGIYIKDANGTCFNTNIYRIRLPLHHIHNIHAVQYRTGNIFTFTIVSKASEAVWN